MKKLLLMVLVLLSASRAAPVGAQGFDEDDRRDALKHGWMFNYDQARALARKTNRPLMVVFRCVP